MEGDKRYRDKT